MYLFARLIGIATYLIALFAIYVLSIKANTKSKRQIIIILYIIVLSVMAFFFVPPSGEDLYRLFDTLHYYGNLSHEEFSHIITDNAFPLATIYFRLIGLTGIDGLLPCITAAIIFSISFYILSNSVNLTDSTPAVFSVAIYMLMSRGFFVWAISNVRTWIVISIIGLCLYRELYKGNSIVYNIPLYLIAALFHATGIVLCIIRVIYLSIEKASSIGKKIRNGIVVVGGVGIAYTFGRKYIIALLDKSESYFFIRQSGEGFFYIWEFLLTCLSLVLTLYLLYLFNKYNRKAFGTTNDAIYRFIFFYIPILVVFSFVEYNLFFRLSFILVILNIPLFISVCDCLDKLSLYKNKRIVCNNIMYYCSIILLIACARGNLCSLKFFI